MLFANCPAYCDPATTHTDELPKSERKIICPSQNHRDKDSEFTTGITGLPRGILGILDREWILLILIKTHFARSTAVSLLKSNLTCCHSRVSRDKFGGMQLDKTPRVAAAL
jgi:hypothetical protein